jgi:adenylosuccinate lyase
VISLVTSPLQTAAEQWFERTLDDSSNKLLSIPEAFLATDGILLITVNVARGLVVYPKTIEAAIAQELPFMATEEILMAGVRAGGDRQALHEAIRRHSQAASAEVKQHGKTNDLLDRVKRDQAFAGVDLTSVMDSRRYIGRSPEQVETFVREVVDPIRKRYDAMLKQPVELRV